MATWQHDWRTQSKSRGVRDVCLHPDHCTHRYLWCFCRHSSAIVSCHEYTCMWRSVYIALEWNSWTLLVISQVQVPVHIPPHVHSSYTTYHCVCPITTTTTLKTFIQCYRNCSQTICCLLPVMAMHAQVEMLQACDITLHGAEADTAKPKYTL